MMFVLDQGSDNYSQDDIRGLQARYPGSRIVLLAENFDFDNMVAAFRAGAHGYIVKDIPCESLVGSLQLVALGERVLPGALVDRLPSSPAIGSALPAASGEIQELLSDREIEILRCLVIGYPNKLISRRLDISEATVKVHVKAILRKLKVQNRTQAAIYALHHGIDGALAESEAERPWVPAAIQATCDANSRVMVAA
ncbi:response regulator transcription factor [Stakelama saccharophila]|uniref:Response regulator transcription factor n=1 Tax=Stakelama saccharophila TaxID=3075605 RepID=A0ABZ0B9Y8_9SPHN|nr:response regulator transcription factor [Stakelama sp. W311]WNO54216.1 response regulator transcription factor [Stakelama sp. W311]